MGKDHELLEAARNGNITVVEKILYQKSKRSGPLASLRRGPGANVQDSSGYSALHHAALNGHNDVVRLLLAHDASPNLPDSRGSSPLHLAAWAGHQDIVKLLLIHPHRAGNPNLQTIDNETPLHCAAQHGHTGALSTLLAYGADPNVTNNRGESPLDLAAQYGRLQAVQMLIRAHPELLLPFKYECTVSHSPLHLASRNGHKNVVDVLLAAGVNVNLLTPAGTALHEAALCGKDNVVRALLNTGADLDATDSEGKTALDLLEQFPAHVTKGIVSVINNHRNSLAYDSESDDFRKPITSRFTSSRGDGYGNNRESPINSSNWSSNTDRASPSSSIGSLGPSSPTPRPRAATADTLGFYVSMAPINKSKVSPTPPKKPPRRNLSVSPTHSMMMSTSLDIPLTDDIGKYQKSPQQQQQQHRAAYEYLYLARSGKTPSSGHQSNGDDNDNGDLEQKIDRKSSMGNRAISVDQYVQMNPTHLARILPSYENVPLRSYNPNRKLRRNRDNYETFCLRSLDPSGIGGGDRRNVTTTATTTTLPTALSASFSPLPMSPSHYQQPPTPEHPPPNATQAELFIHDRIRPLSQEYKRRSGGGLREKTEMGTSPPLDSLCQSLGASSGSLSSSVSLSDRSVSTDCVEEYIGDIPFAGLFKGSTMTLDNPSAHQKYPQSQQSQAHFTVAHLQAERPKTLQTSSSTPGRKSIIFENHYIHTMCSDDEPINTKDSLKHAYTTGGSSTNTTEPNIIGDDQVPSSTVAVLSPFDEQEEWAKISEIMATFDTGFSKDSLFASVVDEKIDKRTKNRLRMRHSIPNHFGLKERNLSPLDRNGRPGQRSPLTELNDWFYEHGLEEFESIFIEYGFDDLNFINGILNEMNLSQMNIDEVHWSKIMDATQSLPKPQSLLQNNNNIATITVDEWLQSICLDNYIEIFKKHLYNDMDRICRIWEIELQTVLEINKEGHRKRILYSVANKQLNTEQHLNQMNIEMPNVVGNDPPLQRSTSKSVSNSSSNQNTGKTTNHRKNRPAPQPPTKMQNLNLRGPSELLLGFPTGLQTQWRHNASSLVSGSVKYDVYYLGSTVVKELRGTESTRKSIQKIKRGDRFNVSGGGNNVAIGSGLSTGMAIGNNCPSGPGSLINYRRPLRLSISYRGVQFIDINSQETFCEHEIRNIDCACQDADDLSHFAYITKDSDFNTHYCHVFNVESMDLATEIILTLGQAFEVAYQIALKESTPTTPIHSSMNSVLICSTNTNSMKKTKTNLLNESVN